MIDSNQIDGACFGGFACSTTIIFKCMYMNKAQQQTCNGGKYVYIYDYFDVVLIHIMYLVCTANQSQKISQYKVYTENFVLNKLNLTDILQKFELELLKYFIVNEYLKNLKLKLYHIKAIRALFSLSDHLSTNYRVSYIIWEFYLTSNKQP